MARLTKKALEAIADKYNLKTSSIEDYLPHRRGSRIKIGFQFIVYDGNGMDFVRFYGSMQEYNNIDIDSVVEKAISLINKHKDMTSLYYLIRLDKEQFVKRYDDEYYQSDFHINVIEKYYDEMSIKMIKKSD
jgi:hypothetical protein